MSEEKAEGTWNQQTKGIKYLLEGDPLKDDDDKAEVEELVSDLDYATYGMKNIRVKVKYWKSGTGSMYPIYNVIFNVSGFEKRELEEFEGKGWTVDEWDVSYSHYSTTKYGMQMQLGRLEVALEVSH